jgi:GH24 family phage-related lysozyme (muramidase)
MVNENSRPWEWMAAVFGERGWRSAPPNLTKNQESYLTTMAERLATVAAGNKDNYYESIHTLVSGYVKTSGRQTVYNITVYPVRGVASPQYMLIRIKTNTRPLPVEFHVMEYDEGIQGGARRSAEYLLVNQHFGSGTQLVKVSDFEKLMAMGYAELKDWVAGGQLKVETLDSNGLNMIANMERNLSQIDYDAATGVIIGIPKSGNDVGYGFDISKRTIPAEIQVSEPATAAEALALLKHAVKQDEKGIAESEDLSGIYFTQNQFNALVSLRYNIGPIGQVDGLLEYLASASYQRARLKAIVNAYYDGIIVRNPANEKYRQGWYSRTERFLDIFFDGNYGYMPIDAVNGRVILK